MPVTQEKKFYAVMNVFLRTQCLKHNMYSWNRFGSYGVTNKVHEMINLYNFNAATENLHAIS